MILPMLRKILWFTALGWLTIVLIGPVLAVLGTILPFALVGALVYLAWGAVTRSAMRFRLADVRDKLAENPMIPAVGRGVRQAFDQGIQKCKSCAARSLRRCRTGNPRRFASMRRSRTRLVGAGPSAHGAMGNFPTGGDADRNGNGLWCGRRRISGLVHGRTDRAGDRDGGADRRRARLCGRRAGTRAGAGNGSGLATFHRSVGSTKCKNTAPSLLWRGPCVYKPRR